MTGAPWENLASHTETLAEEFDRLMRRESSTAARRVFYLGAELQRRADHGDTEAIQFWRGAVCR